MKRTLATVSFALLAVPAFADDRGTPYEKSQFDRGIPVQAIPHDRAAGGSSAAAPTTVPQKQAEGVLRQRAGSGSSAATARTDSIWAKDHNFIAPPL